MIIGLDIFKKYFEAYPDNYLIIGGLNAKNLRLKNQKSYFCQAHRFSESLSVF